MRGHVVIPRGFASADVRTDQTAEELQMVHREGERPGKVTENTSKQSQIS